MDAEQLVGGYLASCNETNGERRAERLRQVFAAGATYLDPMMSGQGHAELDRLIAGMQAQFPGWRFRPVGTPDAYGGQVRFSWELGPDDGEAPIAGTDFAVIEDGRIARVTGFLDRVPAAA